jgi:acyl carrier protein phosphodiesterase
MNFLAHLLLAGKDEGLLVGNFIADSVKGNKYTNYTDSISRGILMHREIDSFTDSNPVYLRMVHKLQPNYGKYSGIIADMFCDYFLANNWSLYSAADLARFCSETYKILNTYSIQMPEESRIILSYMIKNNWLYSYKSIGGINKALTGMSNRMKYYFPMNEATLILERDPAIYEKDFLEFFPMLMKQIKGFTNINC